MRKLEKILTLMRESKEECEIFIKCYDVNSFIKINEMVSEFNKCTKPDILYLVNRFNGFKINDLTSHVIIHLKKYKNISEIVFEFKNMNCNYDKSKAYDDTDVLEEYKEPKAIHDAVMYNPNKNLDAMLGNFFAVINQCVNAGLEPEVKCECDNELNKPNNKGNKVKDVLKVFDKGQVDVKQIIVQMYLKDLTSTVPFVNELVRKELDRIKNKIVTDFNPIHNLNTYNLKFLASVDYLEDIKNCDSVVDLECAYMFYVYEKEIAKELRLLGKPDYSWIKDFIIQKNVMSQKRVDLFKSNKFEIFIEDGSIHLVDVKPNIIYSLDIKYNEAEKTFHL